MSTVIESLEKQELKKRPHFAAGDRVRVHFQVIEGNRKRTQVFEGVVIKRQGSGARETFTVRKQSFGVGVERTFPLHSPKIEQLEVAARGDVRRAKLYYLRDKVGKSARVAERRWGIEDDVLAGSEEAEAVDAEGVTQDEAEPEVVEADGADAGAETDGEAASEGKGEDAEPEASEEPDAGEGAAPDEAESPDEPDEPDEADASDEPDEADASDEADEPDEQPKAEKAEG